jgi:hypothetical protein
MKAQIKFWPVLLLATSLALISPAWFAASVFAQSSPQGAHGIIRDKTDQGFAYMTGGVGIGERETMESSAQDYNLKLSFAEKSGVYLADVDVVVEDQSGKEMISMTSKGPWLYLQLPPGRYTVAATVKDRTKQIKNVLIENGDRIIRIVHWDLPEEFPIYANMKKQD